jgi:hypothetical protein
VTIPIDPAAPPAVDAGRGSFVVLVGLAEVAGAATYAFGSRDSAAIAAVLASQFAGSRRSHAFFLYRRARQPAPDRGRRTIAIGVADAGLLQALYPADRTREYQRMEPLTSPPQTIFLSSDDFSRLAPGG